MDQKNLLADLRARRARVQQAIELFEWLVGHDNREEPAEPVIPPVNVKTMAHILQFPSEADRALFICCKTNSE